MRLPRVVWALVGLVACSLVGCEVTVENLTLAVVLPKQNLVYPWAWPRVGPAILFAIDKINDDPNLLAGLHIQSVFGNSEDKNGNCSDSAAPFTAVDLKFAYKPNAFIGPGCVYTSAPVARFTGHWKMPLITAGAAAFGIDDKSMYPLTTRTGPSHTKLGEYVAQIHQQFNWTTRAMIIYMDGKMDDRPCYFTVEGLYVELPKFKNLTVVDMQFKEKDMANYTSVIQDIKQKGRSEYVGDSRITPIGVYVVFTKRTPYTSDQSTELRATSCAVFTGGGIAHVVIRPKGDPTLVRGRPSPVFGRPDAGLPPWPIARGETSAVGDPPRRKGSTQVGRLKDAYTSFIPGNRKRYSWCPREGGFHGSCRRREGALSCGARLQVEGSALLRQISLARAHAYDECPRRRLLR
ncbi:hypothetical protein NDU88_001128 [Pleurodeles waltl]|uniref:Receptor ligand binding region domain-containing protein n=1 Tax=Pleurodeles waltl TaxID=8319 RepID=A0AAV7KPK0_PLEWA|nr:hypothetical protein NDU88_001128 [Pleurodeles waltl]